MVFKPKYFTEEQKIPSLQGMPLPAGGVLPFNLADDFLKAPYQMIKPDGEDVAKLTIMGDDVAKQGAKEGRKIASDTPNAIDSEKIIKENSKKTDLDVQISPAVEKTEIKNIAEKTEVKNTAEETKVKDVKEKDGKGNVDSIEISKTDLDILRNKLGVPETNTIAVGKTNVKGLEGITFEGQSPKVRSEAGLADLDEIWPERNIKSPGNNPLFTRHAEEVLANDFDRAVIEAGIKPQDVSGILKIHQSNPTGVCRKCIQGLANDNVSPGVLKQLSLKYPNLRIEVTSETLPDVKVTGKSNFVIQNGKYIE